MALKEILELHADDINSQARFLLEGEIAGSLEHPGIVPIYGLGQYADGRPYYAMRLIRGNTLGDAIRLHHEAEVPGATRASGSWGSASSWASSSRSATRWRMPTARG